MYIQYSTLLATRIYSTPLYWQHVYTIQHSIGNTYTQYTTLLATRIHNTPIYWQHVYTIHQSIGNTYIQYSTLLATNGVFDHGCHSVVYFGDCASKCGQFVQNFEWVCGILLYRTICTYTHACTHTSAVSVHCLLVHRTFTDVITGVLLTMDLGRQFGVQCTYTNTGQCSIHHSSSSRMN